MPRWPAAGATQARPPRPTAHVCDDVCASRFSPLGLPRGGGAVQDRHGVRLAAGEGTVWDRGAGRQGRGVVASASEQDKGGGQPSRVAYSAAGCRAAPCPCTHARTLAPLAWAHASALASPQLVLLGQAARAQAQLHARHHAGARQQVQGGAGRVEVHLHRACCVLVQCLFDRKKPVAADAVLSPAWFIRPLPQGLNRSLVD